MNSTARWKWECSLLYFVGYTLLGCVISGLGPFIPFKAQAIGMKETDFGVVFTFRGVGYVLSSLGVGYIATTYQPHRLLALAFFLIAATSFLAVYVEQIFAMALLFFISSLGAAAIDVLSQASLVEVHGSKVDPWMQFLHFCFGFGAFIAPLFLAAIGASSYTLFGVVGLVLMIPAMCIHSPETQKKLEANPEEEQLREIPPRLHKLIAMSFFVYVGMEVSYGGWISTYTTVTGVGTKEQAAYSSSIFWATISIGRVLAVPFAMRFPTATQLRTLVYGCVVSLAVGVVLVFTGMKWLAVYGISAIYGLAMSAVYPLFMSMPPYLKYRLTAKNTSNYVFAGATGESLLPIIFGYSISYLGPDSLFWLSLLLSFVQTGLFLAIMEYDVSSAKD